MSLLDFLKHEKKTKAPETKAEKKQAQARDVSKTADKVSSKDAAPSGGTHTKSQTAGVSTLAEKIILHPHVTEKSSQLKSLNQYVMEVDTGANKIEIQTAIVKIFGVKPVAVNSVSIRGKQKRFGRFSGTTKNRKKVIITLKQGESIDTGEGK